MTPIMYMTLTKQVTIVQVILIIMEVFMHQKIRKKQNSSCVCNLKGTTGYPHRQ